MGAKSALALPSRDGGMPAFAGMTSNSLQAALRPLRSGRLNAEVWPKRFAHVFAGMDRLNSYPSASAIVPRASIILSCFAVSTPSIGTDMPSLLLIAEGPGTLDKKNRQFLAKPAEV